MAARRAGRAATPPTLCDTTRLLILGSKTALTEESDVGLQSEPLTASLLIRNGYVVTMDSERRVFASGAVAVEGGSIVAVGRDREVSAKVQATRTIDAHGAVVHPGFIDNHIHLDYHNIRWASQDGLGWDDSLPIHGEYMGLINEELEYVSSKLAALEMARNGTTCFLEAGGVHNPDAAATAVEEIGIRGVLGDTFVRDIGPNAKSRDQVLKVLGIQLKRNSDPNALVRGTVSASGMGNTSDELLLAAKEMADEHGVVLNMHQSYQALDAESDDRRLGRHPLVHFAEDRAAG